MPNTPAVAGAKKSQLCMCSGRIHFLSPVLTVPVRPRLTMVKDSRYTVINHETFPKKQIAFSQCRCYPGVAPVYEKFSPGSPRSSYGAAPVHAGIARCYQGSPHGDVPITAGTARLCHGYMLGEPRQRSGVLRCQLCATRH